MEILLSILPKPRRPRLLQAFLAISVSVSPIVYITEKQSHDCLGKASADQRLVEGWKRLMHKEQVSLFASDMQTA